MSKSVWRDFKEGYHVRCMFFGIVDIIVGVIIFLSPRLMDFKNIFIYLSFLYLILGFTSLYKSVLKKKFYDWRGYCDVIIALILLSIFFENAPSFIRTVGMIVMFKGFLCLMIPTTREY